VLYLAEVVQKRGLMSSKGELKLLACQKGEQWNAVTNEEPIVTDEVSNHKDGALVFVDLLGSGSDRKIKRIQEGARQVVSLLQTYSRQQEKSKSQEEEIQQWMESLTFQSQELNRREMELEARREQVEQLEQELQQLDGQRQEIQTAREAANRLRQEVEQKGHDLENAWAQLRSEQQRIEQERQQVAAQQQAQAQVSALDAQQAAQLQGLVDQVAQGAIDPAALRTAVETCLQIVEAQEAIAGGRWQQLDGERSHAEELRAWLGGEQGAIAQEWQQWHDREAELVQEASALRAQEAVIEVEREQIAAIETQIESQQSLLTLLEQLSSGQGATPTKVDIEALEAMDLGDLQEMVGHLKQDLDKASRFVSDQEEELSLQQQTLSELAEKISQASEYDRMALETELADERDHYRMLNESLVGSRRNLQEREEVFNAHQMVLNKRQGLTVTAPDGSVDLSPAIARIQEAIAHLASQKETLSINVGSREGQLGELHGELSRRRNEQQALQDALKEREVALQERHGHLAEIQGKITVCEESLSPLQEQISGLREHLEAILAHFTHGEGFGDAIAQIQQIIAQLAQAPQ